MIFTETKMISPSQMQLRDVVSMGTEPSPFSFCVVKQIRDGEITLFRPYVITSEMSYTGGVIPYIGIEIYSIPESSDAEYRLWERHDVR